MTDSRSVFVDLHHNHQQISPSAGVQGDGHPIKEAQYYDPLVSSAGYPTDSTGLGAGVQMETAVTTEWLPCQHQVYERNGLPALFGY